MKIRKVSRLMLMVLGVLASVVTSVNANAADEAPGGLSVEIQSARQDYVLGELVKLTIRIANLSNQAVELPAIPSVENGLVRILVAGNADFREYDGPWSRVDIGNGRVQVAPGSFIETEATLMYHHRMETEHLADHYAKQIVHKYLDTEYAFMEPGTYRVKAVVVGARSARLESEPVTIRVNKPEGVDLQVWKVLETDPELGFFIQTGKPKGDHRSSKSLRQAQALVALSTAYPESRQIGDIRSSLAKYSATLEELKKLKLMKE